METVTELENGIFERRDAIVRLFVVMLGSAPGGRELDYYLWRVIVERATMEEFAEQFAATPQFLSVFPESLTNFQFANEFLSMVFGGEVTPEIHLSAVLLITELLDKGQNRADVALLVAKSLGEIEPGHPAFGDFAGAIARLDNQVAVAEYFSVRLPDSAASASILAAVTSDPATRETGFAAVDELVRGEVFTLTSGTDELEGTDRNDVFKGNLSGQDRIDGGGGFDILELIDADGDIRIPKSASVSGVERLTIDTAGSFVGDLSGWTGLNDIVANNVSSVDVELPGGVSLNVFSDTVTSVNVSGTGLLNLDVNKTQIPSPSDTPETYVFVTPGYVELPEPSTPSDTLQSVTVSGDVGFSMSTDGMDALRTIDASETAGQSALFLSAGDALESVATGSGDDYVVVSGDHRANGFSVDLGAGNDRYFAMGEGGTNSAISGGDGEDDLYLLHGRLSELVNSEGNSIYSGFELLGIVGIASPSAFTSVPLEFINNLGTYNMELLDIREVRLATGFIADVTLWNAAPGTNIEILQAEVQQLTYVQQGANDTDSTSDSLTVDLMAWPGQHIPSVDAGGPHQGSHVESLAIHGIETLEINSRAPIAPENLFPELINTISEVKSDSLTTLLLSGNARLEIFNAPATVTAVVAMEVWRGGVVVGVPDAIGPVTFVGSVGDDDFTGGIGADVFRGRGGDDTFEGNDGADTFHGGHGADILDGGAGTDVYVYNAPEESLLSSSDFSGTRASFDTIVSLDNDPNGDKDFIQLYSGLVSQDDLNRELLRKDPLPYMDNGNRDEADPIQDLLDYIGDGEGFFSDGAIDYAIAVVEGGPAHEGFFVFIDVNDDGDFDAATEMVIQVLAGSIDASSFTIHPGPIIIS